MSASISDLPVPEIRVAEEKAEATALATAPMEVVNLHRDERDVRLLLHLSSTGLLLTAMLIVSVACNIWQYYRRPDRIVVDRTAAGDRVVTVNDRPVDATATVTFGPDSPGDEDKRRLANEWATARYAIDPLARERTIERLLRMMQPAAAEKFVAYLKRNGDLERERSERWQASWRPQLTVIDGSHPYRVNLVGAQELHKVVGGVPQRETRQIMFSLKVMPDKDSGRAAHNLYTGFLVFDLLDVREVAGGGEGAGVSVLPQQLRQ